MTPAGRVYIIGFMGCGKSTTGKKLSAVLGWQFIDLDKEIEIKAGRSINDIFSLSGEGYFRELEKETLLGLKTKNNTIVSCGGGTPCHSGNMDFMLRTGQVVYLKMTPGQLLSRLESGASQRPLINHLTPEELLQFISDKLSERENYYNMASIIVNSIGLDVRALSNKLKL